MEQKRNLERDDCTPECALIKVAMDIIRWYVSAPSAISDRVLFSGQRSSGQSVPISSMRMILRVVFVCCFPSFLLLLLHAEIYASIICC
jgi:hypothetical protein